MKTLLRIAALGIALSLCATAYPQPGGPRLVVFAAASLKDALDEVVAGYPGAKPALSYAASSALARQIDAGAPASIFISADLEWMDYLEARGLVQAGTRRNLLGNSLVLIVPAASAASLAIAPGMPLAQALGDGRLALADPRYVPAGKYARAALEKLGVWGSISTKLAAAENVRAALAFVARGEAPLGIVYETDARAEAKVRILARFDPALHPPVVYPMALMQAAPAPAREFAAHLSGDRARHVFEKHGFRPL